MSEAGVIRGAGDADDLSLLLDALTQRVPTRAAQISAASKMFGPDPAELIAAMVTTTSGALFPGGSA